jgi:uncharacterized membrane protein YdjX (TVP38/TMEM64 family)
MRSWLKILLVAGLAVVAMLAVRYWREVAAFVSNPEELRAWLARLGPLGPLGLIAFNTIQVVVAPVPGYPVQIASGYLFGWWQGSLYAVIGMILGGLLAMTLARVYGRPLVQRVVGVERLERWEQVAHLNSLAVWFVLMLGPLGDAPYYIAGLTKLAVWKLLAIVLLVRTPSVMVSTALGAGLISWRSPWFIVGAAANYWHGGLNEPHRSGQPPGARTPAASSPRRDRRSRRAAPAPDCLPLPMHGRLEQADARSSRSTPTPTTARQLPACHGAAAPWRSNGYVASQITNPRGARGVASRMIRRLGAPPHSPPIV